MIKFYEKHKKNILELLRILSQEEGLIYHNPSVNG